MKNIFADIPQDLTDERLETLLETPRFRMERIVSRGHCSPEGFWYDQENREWVILLQGKAKLRFEDQKEPVTLIPGDYLLIDQHRKHRVEWTDPEQDTIWLAVHHP